MARSGDLRITSPRRWRQRVIFLRFYNLAHGVLRNSELCMEVASKLQKQAAHRSMLRGIDTGHTPLAAAGFLIKGNTLTIRFHIFRVLRSLMRMLKSNSGTRTDGGSLSLAAIYKNVVVFSIFR